MKNLFNNSKPLFVALSVFLLSACGSEETASAIGGETFTINASSIVVKRISNNQVIDVDVSEVRTEVLTSIKI